MYMQVQLSICFVERRIKDKLTAFSRNESTGCFSTERILLTYKYIRIKRYSI